MDMGAIPEFIVHSHEKKIAFRATMPGAVEFLKEQGYPMLDEYTALICEEEAEAAFEAVNALGFGTFTLC